MDGTTKQHDCGVEMPVRLNGRRHPRPSIIIVTTHNLCADTRHSLSEPTVPERSLPATATCRASCRASTRLPAPDPPPLFQYRRASTPMPVLEMHLPNLLLIPPLVSLSLPQYSILPADKPARVNVQNVASKNEIERAGIACSHDAALTRRASGGRRLARPTLGKCSRANDSTCQ